MEGVFLRLQAEIVAGAAWLRGLAAPEPAALIPDDWLDGRQQFGRGHQPHRYTGSAEDGFDDLAVVVIRYDDAILDRVAADDPARRYLQT